MLNQYTYMHQAENKVACLRTQHRPSGELKPAILRSQVEHSTTEPVRASKQSCYKDCGNVI